MRGDVVDAGVQGQRGAGAAAAGGEGAGGAEGGVQHLLRTVPDPHGDRLALARFAHDLEALPNPPPSGGVEPSSSGGVEPSSLPGGSSEADADGCPAGGAGRVVVRPGVGVAVRVCVPVPLVGVAGGAFPAPMEPCTDEEGVVGPGALLSWSPST